jgi:hypothetical protein
VPFENVISGFHATRSQTKLGRCYDLKNNFAKKLAKKVGVFKIKAITLHMPWRHSISRL